MLIKFTNGILWRIVRLFFEFVRRRHDCWSPILIIIGHKRHCCAHCCILYCINLMSSSSHEMFDCTRLMRHVRKIEFSRCPFIPGHNISDVLRTVHLPFSITRNYSMFLLEPVEESQFRTLFKEWNFSLKCLQYQANLL